jgi:hypothetical protein
MMVKFIDVDPKEISEASMGRYGRVSAPIIDGFMERNAKISRLDLSDMDREPADLRSVLTMYIKAHDLPIRVFSVNGALHLERLDLDDNGKAHPKVKADRKTA